MKKPPPRQPFRRQAEKIANGTAADVEAMTSEDLQRLFRELHVHQVELEVQNEELRQAQFELADSRDRFSSLYEFAPVGYVTVDSDSKITRANMTVVKMLGIERNELIGAKFSDFIVSDEQDDWYLHRQAVFANESKRRCVLQMQRADGLPLDVRLESILYRDAEDQIVRLHTAIIDISEARRAQQQVIALNKDLEHRVDEGISVLVLLHDVAAMANLTDSAEQAILYCLRRVCQTSQWVFGHVYLPALDARDTLLPTYAEEDGVHDDFTRWRQWRRETPLRIGEGLPGRVFASGQAEVITGIHGSDAAEVASLCGIHPNSDEYVDFFVRVKSAAASPILVGSQVVGVLVFFSDRLIEQEKTPMLDAMSDIGVHLGRVVERERALRELSTRESHYRSLVDTAGSVIVGLAPDHTVIEWNREAERTFGWTRDEAIGKDYFEMVLPKESHQQIAENIRRELGGKATYNFENPVTCRRGITRTISWNATRLLGVDEKPIGIIAIGRDVTEQKKLQRDIVEVSVKEQRRVGQELHDGIGSELTGIGFSLQSLIEDLKRSAIEHSEAAAKIGKDLDRVLEQVRLLSHGLNPVELDRQGLPVSLQRLADRTAKLYRVTCELQCDASIEIHDAFVADHFYRIAQEAVTNAIKHGRPRSIRITLEDNDGKLVLQIIDDGTGIQPGDLAKEGIGLRNMRYRSSLIGAELQIEPVDTGGTCVRCRLAESLDWNGAGQ